MGLPRAYFRSRLILPVILLVATLQGCATTGRQPGLDETVMVPTTGTRGEVCCAMAQANAGQESLAQVAVGFLGQSRVKVGYRSFSADCSGLATGVYATQGFDLYSELGPLDGGNGVGRIFTHVSQHGRIHFGPTVHPGDLVFFHNTWDFNRDGYANDPLTHVGVVEKVEPDGTVLFVSWVSAGVERYRMNLREPDTHKAADGHVLNDFIRRRSFGDPQSIRYLTGQLFAAFGTLLK